MSLKVQGRFRDKISAADTAIKAIESTFEEKVRVEPLGHGKFKVFSVLTGDLLATATIEEKK